MLKKVLILFVLTSLTVSATAQRYFRTKQHYIEVGIMVGATNYSGDVAQRDIHIAETEFGFGALVRYHVNSRFFLKAQYYSGFISGDDRNSDYRKNRSFRFFSPLNELAILGEFVPFAVQHVSNTGLHRYYISPYVFLGAGAAHTRPDAEFYGPEAEADRYLRVPLPEEGKTNRFFFTMPVGFGLRIDFSERLTFGVEGGWRPVFNDNLDGIRLNGNPDKGDWYYFFGVTASYFINEPWRPL